MPAPTDDGISIFNTLDAFRKGLTETLSPAAGADVADGWAAKIDAADRPDLKGIANLLRQLADVLRAEPLDAHAAGVLMMRAGAHTAEAARTEGEAHLVAPLEQLGEFVAGVGRTLAHADRPAEIAGVSTDLGTRETDGF